MPRPPRPWFRMWSEMRYSPKVHTMPDRLVKPWLFLLCMASEHEPRGVLPSIKTIAFDMRLKEDRVKAILAELIDLKFVDCDGTHYVMHEWDDWQKDSDARRGSSAAKLPRNTASSAAEPPHYDASSAASNVPFRGLDKEEEKEKETERDKEADEDEARPPDHPFSVMYSQKYRAREGRLIPPAIQAAALSLEREFGAPACIEAAGDYEWAKHPNYLIPVLKERRDGKPDTGRSTAGRNNAGRGTGSGASSGDFGLDDWKQYAGEGQRNSPAAIT